MNLVSLTNLFTLIWKCFFNLYTCEYGLLGPLWAICAHFSIWPSWSWSSLTNLCTLLWKCFVNLYTYEYGPLCPLWAICVHCYLKTDQFGLLGLGQWPSLTNFCQIYLHSIPQVPPLSIRLDDSPQTTAGINVTQFVHIQTHCASFVEWQKTIWDHFALAVGGLNIFPKQMAFDQFTHLHLPSRCFFHHFNHQRTFCPLTATAVEEGVFDQFAHLNGKLHCSQFPFIDKYIFVNPLFHIFKDSGFPTTYSKFPS